MPVPRSTSGLSVGGAGAGAGAGAAVVGGGAGVGAAVVIGGSVAGAAVVGVAVVAGAEVAGTLVASDAVGVEVSMATPVPAVTPDVDDVLEQAVSATATVANRMVVRRMFMTVSPSS